MRRLQLLIYRNNGAVNRNLFLKLLELKIENQHTVALLTSIEYSFWCLAYFNSSPHKECKKKRCSRNCTVPDLLASTSRPSIWNTRTSCKYKSSHNSNFTRWQSLLYCLQRHSHLPAQWNRKKLISNYKKEHAFQVKCKSYLWESHQIWHKPKKFHR